MPLRQSPVSSPAFRAAHRRNARESAGPRNARGKACFYLNRLKQGGNLAQFLRRCEKIGFAPVIHTVTN